MRTRPLVSLLLIVAASACGGGTATTTSATVAATTTTTATLPTATTTTVGGGDTLVVPPAGEMADTWEESLFVPYGEGDNALGTAPGGDDGSLDLGPEYGAQAADGTWWFLDAAKLRIAHFAEDGIFLGSVAVPEDVLVDGVYFQYQLPRVLDDGTLVATGFGSGDTRVMLLRDGVVMGSTVPREVGVRVDDGSLLYGSALGDESATPVVVDVNAGTTSDTEWFLARNGDRFRITSSRDQLRIEMPDAPFDRTFELEAGEVGGRAFASIEAATGEDGSLHLFLIGLAEDDESVQLAGYLKVGSDGTVSPVEKVRNPFSPSDPGSPSHLGVRPGTSDPWLMFIDEDGVRVYTRVPA